MGSLGVLAFRAERPEKLRDMASGVWDVERPAHDDRLLTLQGFAFGP